MWTGKKPTLTYLKVFGTVAYMLDKQPGRGKSHPKSKKCLFIGYEPQAKGYRLWCPAKRKTYKSRDVRFLDKFEEDNKYEDFVEQECAKNQKIEINLLQVPPTAEPESSPKFENKPEVPDMVVPRPETPASRTSHNQKERTRSPQETANNYERECSRGCPRRKQRISQ